MSNRKAAIVIRIPDQLHDGLKGLVVHHGESAGVIVRTLLRDAIAQGGVANLTPRARVAPLSRSDK